MKKIRISLLVQVLVAVVAGIALGEILPGWAARLFVTFNSLFGNLLSFSIPLIIVGLVVPAIAELGRGAGRLLLLTALLAYGSTLFSGFFTYGVCEPIFPWLIGGDKMQSVAQGGEALLPYFTIEMPPLMPVMTALLLAFTLGLGLSCIEGDTLKRAACDFKEVVMLLISRLIVPLLPLHIMGIFINMTQSGQAAAVIAVFIKIIAVIFVLHVALLLMQFALAGAVGRKNPFRLLANMMPAYFTALGTQSSAATIPVTLAQTLKNGVTPGVANFVIPLCANIHMAGSIMKIVACSMAVVMMQGGTLHFGEYAGFIMMLGITIVAAPGVPGGVIMASLGLLQSMLGFGEEAQALMIAVYVAIDSLGTACNVTGDGALAVMIDRMAQKKKS